MVIAYDSAMSPGRSGASLEMVDASQGVASTVVIRDVFVLLGKRWTGIIIGTLLERPGRFGELAKAIDGISESVLNERLRELMSTGLVERQLAPGPATAVQYALTPSGEDFRAAFNELEAWGLRNGGICLVDRTLEYTHGSEAP